MIIKHQHFDLSQMIVLERVVFQPPLRADASMHGEACFLYAVNGQSILYAATDQDTLRTCEGVVMKCGQYINFWQPSQGEEPFEALAVHFKPEILQLVYEDKLPEFLSTSGPPSSRPIQHVQVDKMIQNYVESLVFYFENPSLVNDELVKLKVKELILLLINTDGSQEVQRILGDLFNPTRYSFKEIIHARLFDDLSIQDLALLTHLSVSSFKRRFKEVFDDTPARYIKAKRLEKAAELLKRTDDRISDVAYDCGFKELGHFSKSFAAHYGCSPSEYRSRS